MPTIPTHAVSAIAILAGASLCRLPRGAWLAGAACAMLPDADVIGFPLGIRYGDLLGHRGLTHSVAFAAVLATVIVWRGFLPSLSRIRAWTYLFVCTLSHGVLDAATNGGLGIAFFSPFSNHRYFWPWRPLPVSPIGMGFFVSQRAAGVIASELLWIWMPSAAVIVAACLLRTAGTGGGLTGCSGRKS